MGGWVKEKRKLRRNARSCHHTFPAFAFRLQVRMNRVRSLVLYGCKTNSKYFPPYCLRNACRNGLTVYKSILLSDNEMQGFGSVLTTRVMNNQSIGNRKILVVTNAERIRYTGEPFFYTNARSVFRELTGI